MNAYTSLNLLIALVLPPLVVVAVVAYLRPVLGAVLTELCGSPDGAEFWLRCLLLLATSASWVATLAFGATDGDFEHMLRRQLLLVAGGVFVSVAWVARGVWRRIDRAERIARIAMPGGQS